MKSLNLGFSSLQIMLFVSVLVNICHTQNHLLQINANISAAEFSSVVLQAFSKMEEDKQLITDLQGRQPEYFDNFLIVGLHTCGDLAPTLLRVFSQCPNGCWDNIDRLLLHETKP